jgi:hypothetical protein
LSLPVLIAVICAQFVLAARNRVFALGSVLFWAALLPVSNLVPIYRPMADRFLYVPMLGVALMLASVLPRRRESVAALCAAAAVLVFITWQREAAWHDPRSLWSDTVEKNPASYDAAVNLGFALVDSQEPLGAIVSFQRAVRMSKASEPDPFSGLAMAFDALGQRSAADEAYKKAVSIDPRYLDPDSLVDALVMEPAEAAKLKPIATRNRRG